MRFFKFIYKNSECVVSIDKITNLLIYPAEKGLFSLFVSNYSTKILVLTDRTKIECENMMNDMIGYMTYGTELIKDVHVEKITVSLIN